MHVSAGACGGQKGAPDTPTPDLELPVVVSLLTWEEWNQGPLKEQEELLALNHPASLHMYFLTDFILGQF